MIDADQARVLASASSAMRPGMTLDAVRELRDGWHFPLVSTGMMGGCSGIIVHKQTGKLFHLGSTFPAARDIALYDLGYRFDSYDIVVLDVHDRPAALAALGKLNLSVFEPKIVGGMVRPTSRKMTPDELAARLAKLPCALPALQLYFEAEQLEKAREARSFTCYLREHIAPAR
jgi:hypothetical protein